MDKDLISRKDLKEAISKVVNEEIKEDEKWAAGLRYALKLIDNAQKVEPFEPDYVGAERLKARQRGYEAGYHYGMKIGKTLNPQIKQGEWGMWVISEIRCPECLEYFDTDCYSTEELKKCPSCGATMKGGA